jgi:hypothetical protein
MSFKRSDRERAEGWRPVPAGTVEYGLADDVWGFKLRPGYAWRCGNACIAVGVNYKSAAGAKRGAEAHTEEHPGSTVQPAPKRPGAAGSDISEVFTYEELERFRVEGIAVVVDGQWRFTEAAARQMRETMATWQPSENGF